MLAVDYPSGTCWWRRGRRCDCRSRERARLLAESVIPQSSGRRIHHVAFRARDEEQLQRREDSAAYGLTVTEVKDQAYCRAIYFREPGGMLFEIATDAPGFSVDEPRCSARSSICRRGSRRARK